MRSTFLTGQGRRIIPVLLGIVFLNLLALAQDFLRLNRNRSGFPPIVWSASRRWYSTISVTSALQGP